MRNPLFRRYPRELRNNLGKYLGLFLMMVFAVSFTSGFLLAAGSIEKIILGMKETYHIEDGRFACDFEPSDEALSAVRSLGVTLYPDFYKQVDLALGEDAREGNEAGSGSSESVDADQGTSRGNAVQNASRQDAVAAKADPITARVYPNRTKVNLPAYEQGQAPTDANQVALDRVFCENHHLQVGDVVTLAGRPVTISGIMTLPDYQALFEDNNSFMFNALTFTVAQMSEQGYKDLGNAGESYTYAFTFDDASLSRANKTKIEEDLVDALADSDALLSNFIDAEDNQGIGYALDDAQGDQAMWTVLLFLLVVIMGFVFVVLTGSTIEQESSVIGTMLASGWRKRELVTHYLLLPAAIGLVATCVGLAIGINLLCDPFKDLYYHSYSLPPYHTIWSWNIVVLTAVVPYLLLVGITFVGLVRSLRFTPLQFLRHEASGHRRRGRLHLPEGLRYVTRFRLRVLMRNAGNFVTLFFGIMFASLLLLFGLCMLPVVDNYAKALRDTVVAPHQYALKTPLDLEGTEEERECYAAALRIAQDHDRVEANRPAVDALERLQDNKELVDALQRLQNNTELMDALERLQNNTELVDAARRLRNNQELLDAAERLQSKTDVVDAAKRLQDKEELVDAAQRLESKQGLVEAAQRLQDRQDVVEAAQRLVERQDVMDAAQRLQGRQDVVEAAERLQSKQDVVEAAQRLSAKQDLVEAAERLQGRQDVLEAAQRLAAKQDVVDAVTRLQAQPELMEAAKHAWEGTATEEEHALLASADAQTQADLQLASAIDEQTQADMTLIASLEEQTQADLDLASTIDEQTRADMALMASVDAQTQADMALMTNLDAQTQEDLQTVAGMDEQTREDLQIMASLDEQTQADLQIVACIDDQTQTDMEVISNIDDQTMRDMQTVANMDAQTRADIELVSDVSEQTRDDLELVSNLDKATKDDLELVTKAEGQTKADLELLMDLDDATRANVDLARSMDSDLLDDLRLASKIDEDAHVVNTQVNSPTVLAQAEKYAMTSMEVERTFGGEAETITVYGIQPNSSYWTEVPVQDGVAIAGRGLTEKTKAEVGEQVTLHDPRKGKDYEVAIAQETKNKADTALYMTLDDFNRLFGNDADYFNAYASAQEIALDDRYVASSIVPDDMDDISKQMRESMGKIMYMMMAMAVPIYLILIYLLTKTVIDRSARAISYMKVFGYYDGEVNGLYVRPITTFVLLSLVASIPLIIALMQLLLTVVFMRYSGNFPISIPADRLALLVVVGMVAYAVVAFVHVRRIRRVPLSLALKAQE